jgi:hypothetical protein
MQHQTISFGAKITHHRIRAIEASYRVFDEESFIIFKRKRAERRQPRIGLRHIWIHIATILDTRIQRCR